MRDVAIIGGGPAGAALARSLTMRGVDVALVSPDAPWRATYGAWRDDVEHCELGAPFDSLLWGAWSRVKVVGANVHVLARPYVVFDNSRLREELMRDFERVSATVTTIEHAQLHSTLTLIDGNQLRARLVIDATGVGSFLSHSRDLRRAQGGAQTAYGLLFDAGREPSSMCVDHDSFTLMDWGSPPTFLYSATFRDGRMLVEETSLYANPPHQLDELRRRLALRLGGDLTAAAQAVEQVNIPMGRALPVRTSRTVGFGAAAGYVHPVTGYSVAASLRAAPRVAEAIRGALMLGEYGEGLSLVAWNAVWPASYVRTRAWHDMSLAVLRSLPTTYLPKFFDAFFSMPLRHYATYLRIDSEPTEVRSAMFKVFRNVDVATRLRLMAAPGALLRALVAR